MLCLLTTLSTIDVIYPAFVLLALAVVHTSLGFVLSFLNQLLNCYGGLVNFLQHEVFFAWLRDFFVLSR